MSFIGAILAGRTKLARSTVDPAGSGMDGGGEPGPMPPVQTPAPPAPMPAALPKPVAKVPAPIPNTTPRSRSAGIKAGALAKNAMPGLMQAQDFMAGAGRSAEALLRKNMASTPDSYVASLQTQTPDYTQATPTRGFDSHAAALSLVH